ncbi:MAG: phosphatidate cytidylyltransferase [Elusimicrobia bacterium]|nr:phosphatidate cytidylyltransferase [Elusimicrobiota bacterium]
MLLPRLITSTVGVPLILGCAFMGELPFLILTLALSILAIQEYVRILTFRGVAIHKFLCIAGGTGLAAALYLRRGTEYLALLLLVLFLTETLRPLRLDPPQNSLPAEASSRISKISMTLLGALWIGWPMGHLALLRDLRPWGLELTVFLFLSIWTLDSVAYLAGKAYGKRPLTRLSPRKTWEGTLSSFLSVSIVAVWLRSLFHLEALFSNWEILAGSILLCVAAQISDLAESLLKRSAGIKDSSTLLPGHGGILDRFDAFYLSVPLFYYWVAAKST